jgi:hypothetical protein
MLCIICLKENKSSEFTSEHVIPKSIGGTYSIQNVCIDCNSKLGHEVDCHLTEHWLIKVERYLRRIPGKTGKVPNPFKYGTMKGDSKHQLLYLFDDAGNFKYLYTIPRVETKTSQDGNEYLHILLDIKDENRLPEIINKKRLRANLPALTKEDMDELIQTQRFCFKKPSIEFESFFDSVEYKRSVLKIAYELACEWIGERYLEDPTADLLRKCILDNKLGKDWSNKYPIRGTIGFIQRGVPHMQLWLHENDAHIVFIKKDGNFIGCYIRIFQIIEAYIMLSDRSDWYPDFKDEFLLINSNTGSVRRSSFIDEVNRLCSRT